MERVKRDRFGQLIEKNDSANLNQKTPPPLPNKKKSAVNVVAENINYSPSQSTKPPPLPSRSRLQPDNKLQLPYAWWVWTNGPFRGRIIVITSGSNSVELPENVTPSDSNDIEKGTHKSLTMFAEEGSGDCWLQEQTEGVLVSVGGKILVEGEVLTGRANLQVNGNTARLVMLCCGEFVWT